MTDNRVDAALTAVDAQAALASIADIKAKLPFLIDLSIEDRKALPKMGDNSRAFVQKALEVASQNGDFLPRSFDVDEMRRDWELYAALLPIVLAVGQLNELLDDTITQIGSEAYSAALVVYRALQANGGGSALDGELDALAQRFARKSAGKAAVDGSPPA
jgi:hypothetical protein